MSDVIPRRVDMHRMIATELAISKVMRDVEALGSDLRLTECVVLLGRARKCMADFADGIPMAAPPSSPAVRCVEKMRDDYIREHCQTFNDGHWVASDKQREYVGYLDDVIETLKKVEEQP